MKVLLTKFVQISILSGLLVLLQACGDSKETQTVYTINADTASVSFSNEVLQQTSESITIEVTFSGEGLLLGFAPEAEPALWMRYRSEQKNQNTAIITLELINADRLAPKLYATQLRFSTGDVEKRNLVHVDLEVSLLVWQLNSDKQQLRFSETLSASQVASQTFQLSTQSNAWTAATDVDWLSLDITSGTTNATINVDADISAFASAGLYQGNIILTQSASGESKNIPVELALDSLYLIAHNNRIAFSTTGNSATANSATANMNAITQVVKITSNSPLPLEWQASSQADWINLTPMPETSQLLITAAPAKAPQNALSQAEIRIWATNDNRVFDETIGVSLYQNEQNSQSITIENTQVNSNALQVDPLKPYLYAGVGNALHIYHLYTGQLIDSLDIAPHGTHLEQLLIHPEGGLMLAKAVDSQPIEGDISPTDVHRYQINLNDLSHNEFLPDTLLAEPVRFVRFVGRYFVVTQALEYLDENLNPLFFDNSITTLVNKLDAASETDTLFAFTADSGIKRYQVRANDYGSEKASATLTHHLSLDNTAASNQIFDFIVSNDETKLYLLATPNQCLSFDGTDFGDSKALVSTSDINPWRLSKNSQGLAHYLGYDLSGKFIIDSYDAEQRLISSIDSGLRLPEQIPDQVVISSDGQQMVLTLNDETQGDSIKIVSLVE